MSDLISRQDAIDIVGYEIDGGYDAIVDRINSLPSAEPKTRCIAQIKIDRDDMEDLVNEKVNEIVDKMLEQKTDGVFVKGGLTIGGEPPMPEGCMDCKLQDRCLCIPPDLSADEISELYISRRPNCPLSMVAEPKTGKWEIKTETDEYGLKRPKLVCSKCEKEPVAWDLTELFEFCPNCGAMMNGGEEE